MYNDIYIRLYTRNDEYFLWLDTYESLNEHRKNNFDDIAWLNGRKLFQLEYEKIIAICTNCGYYASKEYVQHHVDFASQILKKFKGFNMVVYFD